MRKTSELPGKAAPLSCARPVNYAGHCAYRFFDRLFRPLVFTTHLQSIVPSGTRNRSFLFGVACAGILLLFSARTDAAIRYEVSLAHPEQHLFNVSMEIPAVQGELKLQMAAWNALYESRDFSSHVQQVEAFAGGRKIAIEKLDKLTLEVKATGAVTVKYATFWDDPGPFNTQLNPEHAFMNPAMILLYIPDRRAERCELSLESVP